MADPTRIVTTPGLCLMSIKESSDVEISSSHDSADGEWYTLYFSVDDRLGGSMAFAGSTTTLKETLARAGRRLQEITGEIAPED